MIKINVSYEHPEELRRVLVMLGPTVKRVKKPRQKKGRFLKAYIDIK